MSAQKHIVIDARIRRASTGRVVDKLIENLQDIDPVNRYTVLLEPDDPWKPKAENFVVEKCKYAQFSFNPLEQIGFAWQLYRLKPGLVYFAMTQQPLLYFGKIITMTHDLTMFRFTRAGRYPQWIHFIRMALYHVLFRWSHWKSTKIITPTKYVAKDLAKYQPSTKKKTVVIYEASDHLVNIKAKPAKGVKKPFIFHVGSPFPHKNIKRLLQAFEIVKEQNPDLMLVIGGKKERYYKELEKWAKKCPVSVRKSILFYGFVPDEEMRWMHQNALGYVLPSLSEGFAIPGLEAMANDCPLISSNATCLPEVFGKGAHYFDPYDVPDIARAIQEVLRNDSLQRDLIKNGRIRVRQFSWDKMTKETLALYNKLLR